MKWLCIIILFFITLTSNDVNNEQKKQIEELQHKVAILEKTQTVTETMR